LTRRPSISTLFPYTTLFRNYETTYIIVIDWTSGGRCSICYSGGAGGWVWMGYCDWTSHWHRQCHRGWTAKAVYFSLELVDIWLGIIYHHGIDAHAVWLDNGSQV